MLKRLATHQLATKFGAFVVHGYEYGDKSQPVVALEYSCGLKPGPWLVRVQLACLYGEAFKAIDCDCAQQLEFSLKNIQQSPPGLLIYFPCGDCRGLGLPAKLVLKEAEQKMHLSPYATAKRCGIKYADFECLSYVPHVFRLLGVCGPIRLLTNSPQKRDVLAKLGVQIDSVVNMPVDEAELSVVGREELDEKRRLFGHGAGMAD